MRGCSRHVEHGIRLVVTGHAIVYVHGPVAVLLRMCGWVGSVKNMKNMSHLTATPYLSLMLALMA